MNHATSPIIALHGFLGLPSDFTNIHPSLIAHDLWANPAVPYTDWATAFNDQYQAHSVLMGYSLGGRLALHALLDNPAQWQAAIFVSTHPGLETEEQRAQRLLNDLGWKEKFLQQDWATLMEEWNGQAVFKNHVHPTREELYYNRSCLADALDTWSLGRQAHHAEALAALSIPILWVVGEEDLKFVQLAKGLNFAHPQSKIVIVPKAGHRILWQRTEFFQTLLNNFLRGLS